MTFVISLGQIFFFCLSAFLSFLLLTVEWIDSELFRSALHTAEQPPGPEGTVRWRFPPSSKKCPPHPPPPWTESHTDLSAGVSYLTQNKGWPSQPPRSAHTQYFSTSRVFLWEKFPCVRSRIFNKEHSCAEKSQVWLPVTQILRTLNSFIPNLANSCVSRGNHLPVASFPTLTGHQGAAAPAAATMPAWVRGGGPPQSHSQSVTFGHSLGLRLTLAVMSQMPADILPLRSAWGRIRSRAIWSVLKGSGFVPLVSPPARVEKCRKYLMRQMWIQWGGEGLSIYGQMILMRAGTTSTLVKLGQNQIKVCFPEFPGWSRPEIAQTAHCWTNIDHRNVTVTRSESAGVPRVNPHPACHM